MANNKYLADPIGPANDLLLAPSSQLLIPCPIRPANDLFILLALLGQQYQGIISWPYWASQIFITGPKGPAIDLRP